MDRNENIERNKYSILVTVPNRYWVHISVVRCLLLLMKDSRYNVIIKFPKRRPYVNNLNHIVKDVLEGNYDFWLSMDTDNPPIKNPLDLVSLNKDIIGLPTPVWHYTGKKFGERPIYWNAYDYVKETDAYKEHNSKEGLQRVDAIGTGCFLISKKVFQNKKMQMGAFMRKWYDDGTVHKGNDISFCERARENGFEIYCHYNYPCDHYQELSLNDVIRGFKNMYGDKN